MRFHPTLIFFSLCVLSCNGPHPEKKTNSAVVVSYAATQQHTREKIYDTIRREREKEEFDLDGLTDVPDAYLNTAQLDIWKKRKKQISAWTRQYKSLNLGSGTNIIDEKTISTPRGPRTILAWMTEMIPHLHMDDDYSCPEVTMGKGYCNGRLHYSLVNPLKRQLINTIEVYFPDTYEENDTVFFDELSEFIDYPFSIANPRYRQEMGSLVYHAIGGTSKTEGAADILYMYDFNNDGKKYEFALFNQATCASKSGTLCGYNEKKDSLFWYDWDMTWKVTGENGKDSIYKTREYWIDRAMEFSMDKHGKLSFQMDYTGRGGLVCRNYLEYDRVNDRYSGMTDMCEQPGDSASPANWMPEPQEIKK